MVLAQQEIRGWIGFQVSEIPRMICFGWEQPARAARKLIRREEQPANEGGEGGEREEEEEKEGREREVSGQENSRNEVRIKAFPRDQDET